MTNRAQVVTFLYRYMGAPDLGFGGGELPFSDMVEGEFYVVPVLWAVEYGITNGIGNGIFGVGNPCNRAQAVTFLYRTLTK